jgi:pimeloyl-ACP methyl ester carboxylesterase
MYNNIDFKGKNIHYRDEGSGSVLLFLHGFLENLTIWDDFYNILSQKYRLISIDLPGHGLSDVIAEVHTMPLMAEVIKTILDKVEVEQFVLVGHSMGGYLSMEIAASYPEMLQGLCLFHSHAMTDSEEKKGSRERVIKIIEENHHRFVHTFIPDLFAEANKEKYADEIEALQEEAKNISATSILAATKGMKIRESRLETLTQLTVPVYFIIGKQDPRTPLNKMLVQIAMPKHSEVMILEDCGHMGYIEDKEKTINAIRCFAERCFMLS